MINSLSFHPLYEDLVLSLDQIEALIFVLTQINITAINPSILINYFCITQEMMFKAKSICDKLSKLNYCSNLI